MLYNYSIIQGDNSVMNSKKIKGVHR